MESSSSVVSTAGHGAGQARNSSGSPGPHFPQGYLCHGWRQSRASSQHLAAFCFSGLPVPWDTVTFQALASSLPKLIGIPLAYKHLELLRLRSGLELGEFITVKSVEVEGGCVEGEAAGISRD